MGAHLTFPDGVLSFTTLYFDVVTDEGWDLANEVSSHPVETGADVTDNVRVGLATCQLTAFATGEPFEANAFTTPTIQQTVINVPGATGLDSTDLFAVTVDRSGPPSTLIAKEWDNKLNFSAALKGVGSFIGSKVGGSIGSVVGTAVGGIAAALISPPGEVDTPFSPAQLGQFTPPPTGYQVSQGLLAPPDNTLDFVALMFNALETLRTSATLISVIGSKNVRDNMVIKSVSMHRSADTGSGAEFIIALQEIRFVSTQTVTAPAATVARAKPPVAKGPQNPKPSPPARTRSVMRDQMKQSIRTGGGMLNADQISAVGFTPGDLEGITGAVP